MNEDKDNVENKSEVDSKPENEEKSDPIKRDVQQMLDEMMVQTMKETEQQQNEMDSDLSGTEKIEEVVIKDDSDIKDKNDMDIQDIDIKDKIDTESTTEKKVKCDSEIETDTKKVSSIQDMIN